MEKRIQDIFNESVAQEKKTAELYSLFTTLFPDDFNLWCTLAEEEENHASLILNRREHFFEQGVFLLTTLDPNLAHLRLQNIRLGESILRFSKAPPSRKDAFLLALSIESSSVEHYFQLTNDSLRKSPAPELFRHLVGHEMNHAGRIIEFYTRLK